MRIAYLCLACFSILICPSLYAQTKEFIENPSFEDVPRQSHPPKWWFDCGFEDESPVDVHGIGPNFESDFFGVKEHAGHGQTFLGMVIRDNGTYEGVNTKLNEPLLADSTYKLTVLVNQSNTYSSISRSSDKQINYTSPARLEIWGGYDYCKMTTLLEEYDVDTPGIWTEVTFYIIPDKTFSYLGLYARHMDEYEETNGNILLDHVRLVKVSGDEIRED